MVRTLICTADRKIRRSCELDTSELGSMWMNVRIEGVRRVFIDSKEDLSGSDDFEIP